MLIPFIIEPGYGSSSVWSTAIRAGIDSELARKKYSSVFIDGQRAEEFDFDAVFPDGRPRLAALVGTSPSFVPEMIEKLALRDIDVLLVSYQPPENAPVRGVVRIDYAAGAETLLRHLADCGCKRTALYGCFPNSSTDLVKRRAYLEYITASGAEPLMLDNTSGLLGCFERLNAGLRAGELDSVVCVNDIAAVSLVTRLTGLGVGIPEEIQIASFGGSEVSRVCRPAITVLEMPNFELGRQTVNAFSYLAKSPRGINLSVRVAGELVVRESTRPLAAGRAEKACRVRRSLTQSFYDDAEVERIARLEKLLSVCEDIDRAILGLLLAGDTTERIAEELSLAPESVRYRVRRLVQSTGMTSRSDLLGFIRENGFETMIVNDL